VEFEFNLLHTVLLFGAGSLAGFLNTVAFGGSLLTLPVLIFLKLPTATANGTNRIAIFCQNFSAILGFRRKGVSDFSYGILLTVPAVIGAVIGAKKAVVTEDSAFKLTLAVMMVVMLVLTLLNPTERLQKNRLKDESGLVSKIIAVGIFFLIGIYGGFIQAGVGLLIITALRLLTGMDLVRTNVIKVLVVFSYTVFALGLFIVAGEVDWYLGLTLAVGNSCGAWIGSHWAVEKGERWIRRVLIVAVVAFAARLVWESVSTG